MPIFNTSRSINLETAKSLQTSRFRKPSISVFKYQWLSSTAPAVVVLLKMDGAPRTFIDAAMKKARTAQSMNLSTGEDWLEFIRDDEIHKEVFRY